MSSSYKLPRSRPEAQGVASSSILAFVDAAESKEHELHSLIVLRHGQVIAEGWRSPYAPEFPHTLFSLSKSFASTAAGFAISEGFFSLDDAVISFFPNDLPEVISPNLEKMRVRHLLSMSVGHSDDNMGELAGREDGVYARGFLARPVPYEPGTHFLYNSSASYMISAIVQKTTGKTLIEFLNPRLFEPLGIDVPNWHNCPQGINLGGWGMSAKTEDIAKFGQLYLQKGFLDGKRILPEGWVEEATRSHVSNGDDPENDWNQGYGFQFWRCRNGAFRGDGAFGQYCVVMPEQHAVVAITSNVGNMGEVLNLVWEHLLPGMKASALPDNERDLQALEDRLASMEIATDAGVSTSEVTAKVSGNTYRFETNTEANPQGLESLKVQFGSDKTLLTFKDALGEHEVSCGNGTWIHSETTYKTSFNQGKVERLKTGAKGVWISENVYKIKLCFTEALFSPTLTLRFENDTVKVELNGQLGFMTPPNPAVTGVSGG